MSGYAFLTHWRVRGTAQEVSEVLSDALQLSRWWPSVYLDVKELAPGDSRTGVGRVIDLFTKGWCPTRSLAVQGHGIQPASRIQARG